MKRYMEFKEDTKEGYYYFMVDWMKCLREENNGEIWINWTYKTWETNDENMKVIEKNRAYRKCLGDYGSRHAAINRIREFQEKIQEE